MSTIKVEVSYLPILYIGISLFETHMWSRSVIKAVQLNFLTRYQDNYENATKKMSFRCFIILKGAIHFSLFYHSI